MEVVGRAELKLAEAVQAFKFSFAGKTVLDIGSSTGGFTELALRLGAKSVVAVEKGTQQMKALLRFDARIKLYEKTDIFEVRVKGAEKRQILAAGVVELPVKIVLPAFPEVIVADVSFVSLVKVLQYAKNCLANWQTDFLVMLKPQFEALPSQLNRGVVKNERVRREIVKNFEEQLKRMGFLILKKRDNETVGKNGNKERFYHLRLVKR